MTLDDGIVPAVCMLVSIVTRRVQTNGQMMTITDMQTEGHCKSHAEPWKILGVLTCPSSLDLNCKPNVSCSLQNNAIMVSYSGHFVVRLLQHIANNLMALFS